MATISMVSAKMATQDLLKIKIIWNKCYDAIVFIQDATNKICFVNRIVL